MLDTIIIGAVRGAVAGVMRDTILPQVADAVGSAHSTPASRTLPQAVAAPIRVDDLTADVVARLKDDPAFQDLLAKAEPLPWYRSPVTVGSLLAVAWPILGLAGYQLTAEDQATVVAMVTGFGAIVGGAVSLWGRLSSPVQPVKLR